MITKEVLESVAKINGLKPWQQEKHYLQALILNSLAEYALVFKGGTYLWFFHNLGRFSEDLDFTATNKLPKDLPKKISAELELLGVENSVKINNDNEITLSFRISAKGPLNTSDRDLCYVYVEISKREEILKKTLQFRLDFPAYQTPVKVINGMNLDELAAEKVRALLTRNKARDLYDLYSIIKNKNANFSIELVNKKLEFYNQLFSKEKFIKELQKFKKDYLKELNQLIFGKIPSYDECVLTIRTWI